MYIISELELRSVVAREAYGQRGAVLVTFDEDGAAHFETADMDPSQTGGVDECAG